ncbi:serine/threonine-protein kinase [Nannocystis punicea]|uniref:Serine/threonine-protein kinase n=1 Tax=Nannocystis punicea TaxID=2995304 RepID=A0ABY7H7T5_9BACT|nr:serine/threonine-protein kinase [Nannocystis poenicansa]WAS95323.1 serine/threonine-protein kinase [Nannocystis poenicansa]
MARADVEPTTRESKSLEDRDTVDAGEEPLAQPRPETGEMPTIGRYRVLGRIGAGGMGTVYAARDPMLGREVAIKLARVDGSGSPLAYESRLLREARLLAQVRHPNVVEIHEVGVFRGQVYIVMARIHGQTLRDWQREQSRSWRQTVAKYVAAARGLQAAHAAGLVHRDFKADNALVGDDGRVYVVDFGLARPTGVPVESGGEAGAAAPSSSDSPLTRTGAVVGTPAYMAPEQRAGRPPDVRSDIYSFCVSLYEALHGHRPEYRHDPAATRPRGHNVPRWVDRALARGLAPAASRRYATFEPLIAALGRDPARWWGRVGVAAALVGAGGLVGLTMQGGAAPLSASCEAATRRIERAWGSPQREALAASFAAPGEYARVLGRRVEAALDDYADEWQQARLRACEATAELSPSSAPQLHRQIDCLERAAEGLERATAVLAFAGGADAEQAMGVVEALPRVQSCRAPGSERDLPEQTGLVDALRRALVTARAQAASGSRREAVRLAEQVRARAQTVGDPALEADALLTVGRLRAEDGEIAAAETLLLAAIDVAEANGLDDTTASGWVALATLAARLQVDPERMRERARRAQALLDRIGDSGPRRAALLNALGVAAVAEGRHAEAVRLHREAHERLRFSGGPAFESIRSLQGLANALDALGRRDEALASFTEALALCEQHLGPRHPQRARVANDLGALLLRTGESARARELLEAALAIWIDAYGSECVECGRGHSSLMGEASAAGELGRAEHHARRALAIYRQQLPAEHPDLAAALANLGAILHWRGEFAGAVTAYAEALRLQQRSLPAGHLHRAITESNLGESLVALQRHAEALPLFAAAEPVARGAGEAGEELLLLLLRNKAKALHGTGEGRAARVALEQARALLKRDPGRAQEYAEVEQALAELGAQARAG